MPLLCPQLKTTFQPFQWVDWRREGDLNPLVLGTAGYNSTHKERKTVGISAVMRSFPLQSLRFRTCPFSEKMTTICPRAVDNFSIIRVVRIPPFSQQFHSITSKKRASGLSSSLFRRLLFSLRHLHIARYNICNQITSRDTRENSFKKEAGGCDIPACFFRANEKAVGSRPFYVLDRCEMSTKEGTLSLLRILPFP